MHTTKRVKASLLAVPVVLACVAAQPAPAQLSVRPPPIETYAGDPGRVGDPASWRTPEFLRDNGMLSIAAEFAYAKGYAGQGMNVGMVDSGVFAGHVREHGSLDTNYAIGDRYFSVEAQGGETGPTGGFYDPAFNDSHGTHVSGTVGASREQAREARVYEGRLSKRGKGTLFVTGDNTWHGPSAVLGGKLSIIGSHASPIAVWRGTLGGSGTVADDINVARGVLQPGLSPEEAGRITDTDVAPGNVLHAGDRVVLGRKSDYAVILRGERDYTSLEAAGDVALDGDLSVDVERRLARGTVLTIIKGRSIRGEFDRLRDGRAFKADGHVFRVSYRKRSVTLTIIGRPH